MKEVSTSFLSNECPKKLIDKLNNSNTDYIHFDVMDGNFVDNKFLSVSELQNFLSLSKKKNDVHLMVSNPEKYIKAMSLYNVSYITIHSEIKNCERYIDMIKDYGFKAGISIKPETSVENIFPILDKLFIVLVMSVEPGKSGQKFIYESLEKVNALKEEIKKRKLLTKISIDGGINEVVLPLLDNVDIVVSASYVLNDLNNINKIKDM